MFRCLTTSPCHANVQEWHNITVVEELERAVTVAEKRMEAKGIVGIERLEVEGVVAEQRLEVVERMVEVPEKRTDSYKERVAMEGEEKGAERVALEKVTPGVTQNSENCKKDCSEQKKVEKGKIRRIRKKKYCTVEGCSKSYTTITNLTTHMRTDHGAPKLPCKEPDCNCKFNSFFSLKLHNRRFHNGDKIKCRETDCLETFHSYSVLRVHMRKCHGAPKTIMDNS